MRAGCKHGFVADDVARDARGELHHAETAHFASHVGSCSACSAFASGLADLKEAYRAEVERDEQWRRASSEKRLLAAWPRARSRARISVLAVVGAFVATFVAGGYRWARQDRAEATGPQAPSAESRDREPQIGEVHAAVGEDHARPPPHRTLTALTGCGGCRSGAMQVTAGAALAPSETVVVPPGSHLLLSFSVEEGQLEGTGVVDIEGPARARTEPASEGGTGSSEPDGVLVLDRGVAKVSAHEPEALFSKLAKTKGGSSEWRVEARERTTRVQVFSGEVSVEGTSGRSERRAVHAGEVVEIRTDGTIVAVANELASTPGMGRHPVAAPATRGPALEEGWSRERANYVAAERALAEGRTGEARAVLAPLLASSDVAMAGDAAFLLAQSFSSPRERAGSLARYLDTSPPSPYREQAQLEEASALLLAGDEDEARARIDALRREHDLPRVVRLGLERLEGQLHR